MTPAISAEHSQALDQIIELVTQRNTYRMRASRAEDKIDRVLRHMDTEPICDRLVIHQILED